jgi:hypothetical protein
MRAIGQSVVEHAGDDTDMLFRTSVSLMLHRLVTVDAQSALQSLALTSSPRFLIHTSRVLTGRRTGGLPSSGEVAVR